MSKLILVTRAENQSPFAWDAEPWPEPYSEPEAPIYHAPELREAWAQRATLPAPAAPLETEDDGQDDARTLTALWVLALSIFGGAALFAHYLAEGLTK